MIIITVRSIGCQTGGLLLFCTTNMIPIPIYQVMNLR